jgi:hypothetical protein
MQASSRPWAGTVKKIVLLVFCAVPGLFATIFGPVFFFLEGVARRDQTTMLWTAAITLVGVVLLLTGLGSVRRWPFVIVFASIPWVFFGFATLFKDEVIVGTLTAVIAFVAVALIRHLNVAR